MAKPDKYPLSFTLLRLLYKQLGPLMPMRFGRMAYHTWFTPTRFRMPERERTVLDTAVTGSLCVDDIEVATYRWGDSNLPTILFVHGWSGRGTQASAFVEPVMRAGFSLLSFDAPAHGRTEGRQTSVLQFVDTLLALQQQFGPFHGCITHSVGGMALALAARFGFAPQRAVCICPPNAFDTILHNFCRILNLPPAVKHEMLKLLYATHGSLIEQFITVEHNAADIDFPALLIHDRDDPEIPWRDSEKIHHAWKHSELMLTDTLKHHRIVRDDKVVAAAVRYLANRN